MEKEDLIKLARWKMPFGKYSGRVLIDLPGEGELGALLGLAMEIRREGLESLIRPLKVDR